MFTGGQSVGVPVGGVAPGVVVIGASTGGPGVVERILAHLPHDVSVPIAVCQHMPVGFTELWAERLNGKCAIRVKEAENREPLERGTAYIAPIGMQMRIVREGGTGPHVRLDRDFADSLHVPSIDILMSSVAVSFGSRAMAVLLSGLGSDGAHGMLAVRRAGGHTIAEAQSSAVAYSMPGSAVELGAVAVEAHGDQIASMILERMRISPTAQ